jgi:hypothetical protein
MPELCVNNSFTVTAMDTFVSTPGKKFIEVIIKGKLFIFGELQNGESRELLRERPNVKIGF